jgi:ribonuclease P protein component
MPARFRPRQRLRTRAEFDRVFRRGVRLDGRWFSLIAAANGGEEDRLGLAVSRRVGGAVVRNRARRLLREAFRHLARGERPAVDIVVLAKPELASRGLVEIDGELRARLRRLPRAPNAPGAGAAAPR